MEMDGGELYGTRTPTFVARDTHDLVAYLQAQWIWFLNLVCFLAHASMIFVTFHFAYWRHDLDPMRDTAHVMIPIYRIRNIPTKFMLDNNISQWSQGWNFTSADPNSGLFLEDNGMPINFASLIISFFATSAFFHFLALVLGAFERTWFWYWRCVHATHVLCARTPLTVPLLRWQAAGRLLRVVALGRG